MQNLRRMLKQPMSLAMPMKMADGGWQARQDLANAQTGASSIVPGQARTNAQAQVKALTPGVDPTGQGMPGMPTTPAAGTLRAPTAPSAFGGTNTYTSAPPSAFGGTNTYTSAPAPATPVPGGPITRVGNSFSNFSAPNQDPMYTRPGLDPNHAGNQTAFASIQPMAGSMTGSLPPMERQRPSAPDTLGLRDGGGMPYRKGYADGGKVVGPGTGISDSVPARYSAGEYVLPADTAAHVGYDKLDAIKDATHTPAAMQHQGATPHRGHTLRMANGGMDDIAEAIKRVGSLDPSAPQTGQGAYGPPPMPPPQNPAPKMAPGGAAYQPNSTMPNSAAEAAKAAAAEAAHGARMNAGVPPVNDGRYGLPPNPEPVAANAAPATPAAPTTLRGRLGGYASAGYNTAASAVKAVGPGLVAGAAGGAAAGLARSIGNPAGSPGAPQDIGNAAQIPTDGYAKAPEAQPYNFFTDNEVGRQVGNTLNAVAPLTMGAGAALRGASVGAFAPAGAGAKMITAANLGSAAAIGAAGSVQAGRETPNAPAAAPASDQQPATGQQPAAATQGSPAAAQAQAQAQAQPQAPGPTGRDVMAMNNRMADSMASDRLAAEEASRSMPGPKSSANDWQTRNALRNMEVSASSITGTQKERMQRQAAFQQAQGNDMAVMAGVDPASIADIKARTDMALNSTARRGQDLTYSATLRGQDTTLQGHMAPAQLAAANRDLIMRVMAHPTVGNDPARGAAALTGVGRPDLAEGLQKQADASLKMAGESDGLVKSKLDEMKDQFKGQYINPDKNGTPEATSALADQAWSRFRLANPTAHTGNAQQRAQSVKDGITDSSLIDRFSSPQGAGFSKWVPEAFGGNRLPDGTMGLPSTGQLRGATIDSRSGAVGGRIVPGTTPGGYTLRYPGGSGKQDVGLGALNDEQYKRLDDLIKKSNK